MTKKQKTIIKREPVDAFITITLSKDEWKQGYAFRARVDMRIISFLFPGFLKIKTYDQKTEDN
jgi:hypothetical protein